MLAREHILDLIADQREAMGFRGDGVGGR